MARKLHQIIALRDCNPSGPERFLVVGGYGLNQLPLAEAEIYTMGGNFRQTATTISPTVAVPTKMTQARVRHAVVCLPNLPGFPQGGVLISGGIDPTGRVLDTAEIYDPATETFAQLGTRMNSPRADHTMTLLPDGRVLVVGGFDQFGNALASAETYDLTMDLFSYTSTFPGLGRYGHVAVPWKGGAINKDGVLLIGGADSDGNVLPLVEMFYP
ncbi:MAG TPA: kelch repeat-containing protein [Candidatus Manganitrophaceae bacterium]|nr:kelch repeat-containing protein [Candidatus Manganitrophaceae bacterium]